MRIIPGGEKDRRPMGGVTTTIKSEVVRLIQTHSLTELFHPSYNLPSKHREAYKAGWERTKQEKNK